MRPAAQSFTDESSGRAEGWAGSVDVGRPRTGACVSEIANIAATEIAATMTARNRPTAIGGNRRGEAVLGSERCSC